ncbi:MAG: flavodoxin-dependent (E)-4-hydroxy-3-methylbut-2-enyl-diphosphate synthase [Patescibacteria group bacterium]
MTGEGVYPARRRASIGVRAGGLAIGGGAPVSVQSMANADPHDLPTLIAQVNRLAEAGCELVRLAVPDLDAARNLAAVKRAVNVPLAADIHFDHRLALAALDAGVDKLRLNPGNIGGPECVRAVAAAALAREVPIRVGVNAGSLPREMLARHGGPTAAALVDTALAQVRLLEDEGCRAIVISVKASDVTRTIEAYRLLAGACPYPLHLGLTEAGLPERSLVHSSIALGILLAQGIGDTIRVSLTGDPEKEVAAGYEILRALELRARGPTVIACPTCGRCAIDLPALARQVSDAVRRFRQPWTIAVMGCAVNGPGEARQADLGVAGGRGEGLIFRRGRPVRKVPAAGLLQALLEEIESLAGAKNSPSD